MNSPLELAFTWHAQERMRSLQISETEVYATTHHPLGTQPGGPGHSDGRVVYIGEHVLVVVAADTVITVQLRSVHPFVHGLHDRFHHPDTPERAA